MKTAKPLLEDKLVTWKRAYEMVLAELRACAGEHIACKDADLIGAAARTAAILIQGVEHNGHD